MTKLVFQSISIASISESKTNPRGKTFTGPAFDDLVASIREKGILVPVIVRKAGNGYEIVAGSRRLAAARQLKLKEIPANIQELTDAEAQEVQIIENLQRADVHPLDEGHAYRELMEKSKYEVPSIAAKVGKSESYIRQRLFLTNLSPDSAKAYRAAKFTDGHAVMIARLSENDQAAAVRFLTSSSYHLPSLSDLKEHIETEFSKPLERQPWLTDKAAMSAVGPCKECPPNIPGLFGAVKEGACTDKKCWKRKMGKYIDFRKEKAPDLILISEQYSYMDSDKEAKNGILSANKYEKPGPRDKCKYSVLALVAAGRNVGQQIRICVAKECKVHGKQHSSGLTPAEKSKREKEQALQRIAQEKREKKENEVVAAALKNVKWPITKKTLDVLFECAFQGDPDIDEVGKRRYPDTNPPKGESYIDWDAVLRKAATTMTDREKAQLLVEIMISNVWFEKKKQFLNRL